MSATSVQSVAGVGGGGGADWRWSCHSSGQTWLGKKDFDCDSAASFHICSVVPLVLCTQEHVTVAMAGLHTALTGIFLKEERCQAEKWINVYVFITLNLALPPLKKKMNKMGRFDVK